MDLPRQLADAVVQQALEDEPNECCGILAGPNGGAVVKRYAMTNTQHSPYRYSMDGREMNTVLRDIDDQDWELQVIYHSHTHSPAEPSKTDIGLATYPDSYYLIVSLLDKANPDLRIFRIVDGEVSEEPVVIT